VARMRWLPLVAAFGLAGTITRIATNSVLFTLLYLGIIIVLFGGIEPLRQFARLIPDLVPGLSSRRKSRSVEGSNQILHSHVVESAAQKATYKN
jgi:hypothetical protein